MTASHTVLACKKCGQKVRAPADRGSLSIRCPRCGNKSRWTPKGNPVAATTNEAHSPVKGKIPEVHNVSFFCAQDGAEFSVIFARDYPTEKYRIRSIQALAPDGVERPKQKSGQWPGAKLGSTTSKSIDAKYFDMAGWQCAHCKHDSWPAYVKCSTCHRLVCGCKVISIRNGKHTFQCAPDCGGSGVLAGEISTYEAQRQEAERPKREGVEQMPRLDARPSSRRP